MKQGPVLIGIAPRPSWWYRHVGRRIFWWRINRGLRNGTLIRVGAIRED